MRGIAPSLLVCALLVQATAWASEPSVAVVVATSSGGPGLSVAIDALLPPDWRRVVSSEAAPDDSSAGELREELGVDRLIVIAEGSQVVMVTVVDVDRVRRRFAAVTPETFDAEVLRLVREAPPLVRRVEPPAPAPAPVAFDERRADPPRDTVGSYGTRFTAEVGATIGYYNGVSEFDYGEQIGKGSSHVTDLLVSPRFGFFPVSSLQFLALLAVRSSFDTTTGFPKESYAGMSMGGGVAVLPRVGSMRIGPQVTGAVVLDEQSYRYVEIGRLRLSGTGTRATVGLVAKIPLGPSALLTIDAHYFSAATLYSYHADEAVGSLEGSGTDTGVATTIGFSYWHGHRGHE